MTDAFASKVYPLILYVLGLLDRIQQRRGPEPTPKEELPRLKQYLGQLDSRGNDQKDFELARSALVYWIDELLVNSSWRHANEWKNHTLERELLDSRDRAWEFFEKAKAARALARPDALETFYLCVALGFLGIYRSGESRATAFPSPLPPAPPAPKPAQPAPGRGPQVSWFEGEQAPVVREQTWGLPAAAPPGKARPGPSLGDAVTRPVEVPLHEPSHGAHDLPPSLEDWAKPVFAQIAPGVVRAFAPSVASDSQRDARPLVGQRTLQRSAIMLFWMGLVTLGLLAARWWM